MKDEENATALAESMRVIGTHMGRRVVVLLTDMDQPLGRTAGNALEVVETVETLQGGGPEDFCNLCRELSAWMIHLGGQADTLEDGRARYDELIRSGAGATKFQEIIERQGGDPRVVDDPQRLPQAREREDMLAPADGFLARMETERMGWGTMALGAGRQRLDDMIDPAVGVIFHKKVGDSVRAGEPLATLHYNQPNRLAEAQRWFEGAFVVEAQAPAPRPLILKTLA
jgi:pyrimidine-nucleoside phosphorylase